MRIFYKEPLRLMTGNVTLADFATPTVRRLGRNGELALIEVRGDIDRAVWRELESLSNAVALNSDVHTALLVLDCPAAHWPCLEAHRCAQAIMRLRRAKPTYCFIDGDALGASYIAAAACDTIYARPTARFGLFGACDENASLLLGVEVTDARPQIACDDLADLSDRIVSGEQAETLGLVDHLTDSPERLIADLFHGEPALPFRVLVAGLVLIIPKGDSQQ